MYTMYNYIFIASYLFIRVMVYALFRITVTVVIYIYYVGRYIDCRYRESIHAYILSIRAEFKTFEAFNIYIFNLVN